MSYSPVNLFSFVIIVYIIYWKILNAIDNFLFWLQVCIWGDYLIMEEKIVLFLIMAMNSIPVEHKTY